MLGKYLDALPEEALRRIIAAKAWRTHGYADASGARCLLGHAEDWYWDSESQSCRCRAAHQLPAREAAGDSWLNWPPLIGRRFDRLAERLGTHSAVRLIQDHAASRLTRFPLPHTDVTSVTTPISHRAVV